jgi:hypothetical protein
LLWLAKQRLYPDRRFEEQQPLWIGFLYAFVPLAGYYLALFLLISRHIAVAPAYIALMHRRHLPALRERRAEVLHAAG